MKTRPKAASRVKVWSLFFPVGVVSESDGFGLVADQTEEDPAMDLSEGGGVGCVSEAVGDGGGKQVKKAVGLLP